MGPEGLLPVDKPVGPTSHDVVARARRALGTRRIGHTGTLDPFASGLLLLCLGRATRLAEYLTGQPKAYRAVVRLGQEMDSDDLTGAPVGEPTGLTDLSRQSIEDALAPLRGPILQLPSRFSAKKVAGERAYHAARRGEEPALEPVAVTVHRLELVSWEPPDAVIDTEVSSGTYVRALGRDIGRALGVGAHLRELRRTGIGERSVTGALPLESLDDAGAVEGALLTPLQALDGFPRVEVGDAERQRLARGQAIESGDEPAEGPIAVHQAGELLAVAEWRGGELHPRKVFAA
jgi:tRNA pseudouridine55 synthase